MCHTSGLMKSISEDFGITIRMVLCKLPCAVRYFASHVGCGVGLHAGITGSLGKNLVAEQWVGALAARMVALALLGVAIFMVFWNTILFYRRNKDLL